MLVCIVGFLGHYSQSGESDRLHTILWSEQTDIWKMSTFSQFPLPDCMLPTKDLKLIRPPRNFSEKIFITIFLSYHRGGYFSKLFILKQRQDERQTICSLRLGWCWIKHFTNCPRIKPTLKLTIHSIQWIERRNANSSELARFLCCQSVPRLCCSIR